MQRLRSWLLQSVAAGIAGVAGAYAVAGFMPAFITGTLAAYLARVTPGVVVTFAITVLGDLGKLLSVVGALVLSVLLFASLALLALAIGDAVRSTVLAPVVAAAAVFGVGTLLTGAPLASLVGGAAAGLVLAAAPIADRVDVGEVSPARRRTLGTIGAALAAVGIGYPLGVARTPRDENGEVTDPEVSALLREAGDKSLAVEGLEPLVSDEFYQVDINAADPTIDADDWTLSVTGAVETPFAVTYDELTSMESREVFNTLRCVGESLNGTKMDNALWTVVPMTPILERAGVDDQCCVMLRAADGFYEEFPVAALKRGLLAYRMNGRPLPRGHGHPVRALIPGHWGEINVKWATEMEILDRPAEGYWEMRGWHGTGPVNTVAKLHVTNRLEGNRIQVAGHAYAGTRGISAVEVSTDGGRTWSDATLSEPLPGADVWRQWAYEYDSPGERHEVVVRAIEADGTVQSAEQAGPFPNGPSGWVRRELQG
ncbi:molybdopterin-dependent oxidoreductase [Halorarius litoreus]|uniref:molybdopterin-dependent oxidoreductase n=1 Tax=Halorarius litoreus TaxID=2962676 RepID=UPI0020CCB22D|nr:molybdopterin-dependent oxidoreductase [Halorarius litoreus]